MTILSIVNTLKNNNILTKSEEERLRGVSESTLILQAVIQLFEERVEKFIKASLPMVKRSISDHSELKAVEKIIHTAMLIFFHSEPLSPYPLAFKILSDTSPDLLLPLGLRTATPENKNVMKLAQEVFTRYSARYRVFKLLNPQDLDTLCQEAAEEKPDLFPVYLLSAFKVSSLISNTISNDENHRGEIIAANREPLFCCIQNTIFYIGSVLHQAQLKAAISNHHLRHLQTEEDQIQFATLIAQGVVDRVSQKNALSKAIRSASDTFSSDKILQKILPALTFLEIKISLNSEVWEKQLNEINKAIDDNQKQLDSYKKQVEECKSKAMTEIDQWRASIPERPFYIAATTGAISFNLK